MQGIVRTLNNHKSRDADGSSTSESDAEKMSSGWMWHSSGRNIDTTDYQDKYGAIISAADRM